MAQTKRKKKGTSRKSAPGRGDRSRSGRRSSSPPPNPFAFLEDLESRYRYELAGMALLTLGTLILASLLLENSGVLTRHVVYWLRQGVGEAAFLVPVALIIYGILLLVKQEKLRPTPTTTSALLIFLAALILINLRCPPGEEFVEPEAYGGYIGAGLAYALRRTVGNIGSYIVLAAAALTAWIIIAEEPLAERYGRWRARWAEWAEAWAAEREERRAAREAEREQPEQADKPRRSRRQPEPAPSLEEDISALPEIPQPAIERRPPADNRRSQQVEEELSLPLPADQAAAPVREWPFPSLDLIEPEHREPVPDGQQEIQDNIQRLEHTLASFGVQAQVVNVERGPSVTRYELTLAAGVRVNRIVNLADDLTLALAAHDVRVEAPVPGKGVVGIEVPNRETEIVHLVDLLRSQDFERARSKLVFALGRDITGHLQLADLTRMPHLLIGGATNSGKSVCLNALIVSILHKATPQEVRFLMIDPKRVELTFFNGIPHLDRPVVTEAKNAADLLRGAIREMESRYRLFAEQGVRNIASYNRKVDAEERLAYLVIIIDELADLMMQAPAEFEACICRIAQLARATGIHLVIATQRPSVNVITGTIKANIPSRIAFAVASQVDSRTILDMVGAERLIGRGDMLNYPIDANKPMRIQGAFIDEDQVRRLVDCLKQAKQQTHYETAPILQPVEADQMPDTQSGAPALDDEDVEDDLFEEVVQLVLAEGQASTSRLQRKFSIGYNRAGRLMDLMEARGIVGPADGSKPRKVLISSLADFYQLQRPDPPGRLAGEPGEETGFPRELEIEETERPED